MKNGRKKAKLRKNPRCFPAGRSVSAEIRITRCLGGRFRTGRPTRVGDAGHPYLPAIQYEKRKSPNLRGSDGIFTGRLHGPRSIGWEAARSTDTYGSGNGTERIASSPGIRGDTVPPEQRGHIAGAVRGTGRCCQHTALRTSRHYAACPTQPSRSGGLAPYLIYKERCGGVRRAGAAGPRFL